MTAPTPEAAPHAAPSTHAPRAASRYLRAARGEPVDTTPVWFMRQAGRALPEYRAIREQASLREITRDAALCAEVTLQPVRRLGVDAAILFADITTPFEGMGIDCEIREGVGPVIERPVRSAADLARLRPFDADASVAPLLEAIALIGRESPVPLIGFAGAPFTLACYLVEGGPSRDFVHTKRLMHEQPTTWAGLMDRLVEATTRYLGAQVAAGADALQVFDSWVGGLSPLDYERRVRPWMRRLFDGLRALDVPVTHFGVGTAGLLPLMASAGGDVVGLDWRISLSDGRALVAGRPVQGNLDPALLLAGWGGVEETARWILAQNEGRPGHVFNLGHGVLPGTDPDLLARLVDLVHEAGATR
ncbi:MAG TPA: uroporphyrinogen decarboxylase [Candidatus Limnocylindrales bacterium]|nr:uroporphyrinogen decarboxylase [Candidatus Limnocylindrales bacterium]